MTRRPVVAIGWDVGGWCGTKQGIAALSGDASGEIVIHRQPVSGSLADWPDAALFDDWVRFATNGRASASSHRVVVAVDAPFGFPEALGRLLAGQITAVPSAPRALDVPYAYRATDRSIAERFKLPLSAAFDKLGNNTTVAMHYLARWRRDGLNVLPFDKDDSASPVALEVYPAVVRESRQGSRLRWLKQILRIATPRVGSGSDEEDALVCAALALAYGADGAWGLPRLEGPSGPLPAGEGWNLCAGGALEAS